MLKKKSLLILAVIFLLVLALRLYLSFQTPHFNYDGYFALRQVEHIKETGLPLYNDPLSFGGKTQLFSPAYFYILTFFSILAPVTLIAKILPNIFASLILIVVYFISLRITKDFRISLIAAFMSGFIPIMFFDINSVSMNYLSVLLIFGIIYCLTRISEKKFTDYALILMFILALTSPLAFVLIFGLILYLTFLRLENQEIELKDIEVILFFTFLVFWINLLIYKKAFVEHGIFIIWQNVPVTILSNTFSQITFIEAFYTLSVIPLILGLWAVYKTFNDSRNKILFLLSSVLIATFLLFWFKLLDLVTALIIISVTLVILGSYTLKELSDFIEKTKISSKENILLVIFIVLFIVTAIIPSYLISENKAAILIKLKIH